MKRVFVSLPDGVWKIINKDFQKMGDSESEIIRNMIISFLSERGYFVNSKGYEDTTEIHQKIDVLQKMLMSMIDVLEEKGVMAFPEWESKLKKKVREDTTKQ
jgi:hypothetical protein